MESNDTFSFIITCCFVARCFKVLVRGSEVMDAEKLQNSWKKRKQSGTSGTLAQVTTRWNGKTWGHLCGSPVQGQQGDVGALLLASPSATSCVRHHSRDLRRFPKTTEKMVILQTYFTASHVKTFLQKNPPPWLKLLTAQICSASFKVICD